MDAKATKDGLGDEGGVATRKPRGTSGRAAKQGRFPYLGGPFSCSDVLFFFLSFLVLATDCGGPGRRDVNVEMPT